MVFKEIISYIKKINVVLFIYLLIAPVAVFAAGIVPCGGATQPRCDFNFLIVLAQELINFLIFYVAAPLAAVAFAIAGVMMMTARDNEQQVTKAKQVFSYVLWGFIVALSAWLVVELIVSSLVDPAHFDPSPYLGS